MNTHSHTHRLLQAGPVTHTPPAGEARPEGESLIERLRQLPSATERVMSSGETLHAAGQLFDRVSLPLLGCFKVVSRAPHADGRILSLHLRGDWIGLDAMVSGWHANDTIAVGSARVLTIELRAFRQVCRGDAELFARVQASMRRVLALPNGSFPCA